MYIRTVMICNLIEAALDQRNPSRKLSMTLNAVLVETDHRDRQTRWAPMMPRRRLKANARHIIDDGWRSR